MIAKPGFGFSWKKHRKMAIVQVQESLAWAHQAAGSQIPVRNIQKS